MENKHRKQASVRELPELSSSETREGVLVRVRCVEVAERDPARDEILVGSVRYEIYMEARGHSAIADVSGHDGSDLSVRVDELVSAFVDSLLLTASTWASP